MNAVNEPMPLGDAEVHDIWADAVGERLRIFVGHCGDQPRATLVVTDANGLFGLTVDTVRMMQLPALLPPILVVGIGYPAAAALADTVTIRARDLTATPVAPVPGSGGAPAFLEFLRKQLRPWLAARFPSSGDRRIFFGHSLGGLFGVYAMLTEPSAFDDYIISSPSLWWDANVPLAWEATWAADHHDLPARAYFGIGALETDEGRRLEATNLSEGHPFKPPAQYLDMVEDLIRFTAALRQREYPSLTIDVNVFADEFHATVPAVVLTHGLRRMLGP